ncbi:MAG: YbfA family protein [Symbiopectobacterium sp.]
MSIYTAYPLYRVLLRRVAVVAFGLLELPVMLFRTDRARFYSYLHLVWLKTSDQPVWMAQSEEAAGDFSKLRYF